MRRAARDDGDLSVLSDKIILVSGGTQGVGAGIARAAAHAGAVVVVTGRRPDVGAAFVDELAAAIEASLPELLSRARTTAPASTAESGGVTGDLATATGV